MLLSGRRAWCDVGMWQGACLIQWPIQAWLSWVSTAPPPLSHSSYARQLVHFVMAPVKAWAITIKSNILHKPLSFTNPSPSLLNSFPSRKAELTKIFMSNLQRPLGRPCWYLTGDIWHWLPHRSAEMYGRWMRPDAFADPQEFSRSADWFGQLVH